MGPKKDQSVAQLQKKLEEYEKKFRALEVRVEKLEASESVLKAVTSNLRNELDSLDQYGRRSNILIRNIEIDETDSKDDDQEKIEIHVKDIIQKELKLPACAGEIDKLHRVGQKKEYQNKKFQNIVVRFKSHRSRYQVYRQRAELKNNVKINPHLTKKRGKLLHESIEIADKIGAVNFVYANIHGDICVRLTAAVNGTEYFSFQTTQQFLKKLSDLNIVELDAEGNLVE